MPEFTPTKEQYAAIHEKDRSILVSAAAGSGKTKVLTERLLDRIADDADIDSFLIITFTKAAAAELRGRITQEIAQRLGENPDNRRLRRQNALCQKAHIGTIHSFCASFLRENCHAAGISPEFTVIEDDRSETIKRRVIEKVMERAYEDMTEEFKLLCDSVGRGRDDRRLSELVLELHNKLQSHARPEKWARQQLSELSKEGLCAGDTPWGKEILSGVKKSALYWAGCLEGLAVKASYEPKTMAAYGESLCAGAELLRELAKSTDEGWDKARMLLPVKLPALRSLRDPPDPELAEHIKAVREVCKKETAKYESRLGAPEEKLTRELHDSLPRLSALVELICDFDKAYSAEKRRRNELDFSDLEHFTVSLLTDENGEPTQLAREYSERFCEIMVDEYQDVNSVQDCIFRALSRNGENLFMVGDVKQSIYRFRLADPGIFLDKYESYPDLDDALDFEPARIMLRSNFRSRREITEAVNHVFRTCMSHSLGEIDYDDNARLVAGADYEGSVPVPELMLVDVSAGDEDDTPDKCYAEASAVARRIKELIGSKTTVTDHGEKRPLEYGDIAILMRAGNAAAPTYSRALTDAGIPVSVGQGGRFFEAPEISAVVCLLAVIDNPHQDIPLIAVLRSPFMGFSADELSEIRAKERKSDFWTAFTLAAEDNAKYAQCLDTIRSFREGAHDMELGELLRRIYTELNVPAICSAMSDGAERTSRLTRLLGLAKRFEATGYKSLHRFVLWLGTLRERGIEPASLGTGNAVQIMTVHKSKGLEFPVVFLCDTGRRFMRSDGRAPAVIHPELGFGLKVTDVKRGVEYPSLAMNAIKMRSERESMSEEMRLLYVAMTRAKERLIMTAAVKEPEAKLQKLQSATVYPVSPETLISAQSMSIWLMQALLSDTEGRIKLTISREEPRAISGGDDASEEMTPQADPQITQRLKDNLAYRYPFESAKLLPSKITATELKQAFEPDPEAQSLVKLSKKTFRTPDFMREEKRLTGAEKGVATHTLLQYIDYSKAVSIEGIEAETKRLISSKHLSERQAQAVDKEAVYKLFSSELGRRIMNADKLMREFKFSLLCPAESFFLGGAGESVLLQGVIDCCIEENGELTVIDYKTDRVSGAAMSERAESYESQVKAYAMAINRMTGKPVKECVLYFLHTGQAVRVKPES